MVMASPRPLDSGAPFGGMGMGMGSFRGGAGGRGQPAYSGVQRTRREDNLIGKSLFVAKGPYRQAISFFISFNTLQRTRREANLVGKSLFVAKGAYRQDLSFFVSFCTVVSLHFPTPFSHPKALKKAKRKNQIAWTFLL